MVEMCINLNCHLKRMQNTSINHMNFNALNHLHDTQTDASVSSANERLLIDGKRVRRRENQTTPAEIKKKKWRRVGACIVTLMH